MGSEQTLPANHLRKLAPVPDTERWPQESPPRKIVLRDNVKDAFRIANQQRELIDELLKRVTEDRREADKILCHVQWAQGEMARW